MNEEVFEIPEEKVEVIKKEKKAPVKKAEMSDEKRQKLLDNLRRGRETRKANLEASKKQKLEVPVEPVIYPKEPTIVPVKASEDPMKLPKETKVKKVKIETQAVPTIDLEAEKQRLAFITNMVKKSETRIKEPRPTKKPIVKTIDTQQEAPKAIVETPKVVAPVVKKVETPKVEVAKPVITKPVVATPIVPVGVSVYTYKKMPWA